MQTSMAKGSYGFILVKTETSRKCQQLLFSASNTYFPKNAFVLLIDNQNHPKSHGADRFDFTPRENRRLHSKVANGKFFSPSNHNALGCSSNPHVDSVRWGDEEQTFEQPGIRHP